MTEIQEHELIWFPGIYGGRKDEEYTQPASDLEEDELVRLVQKRAKEDGEWAIENGHVGDNETNMRKMMEWVSDPNNIRQCFLANVENNPTVDWICRDLANASKWIMGTRG